MNQCVRANIPALGKYVVETQCGPGAPARRIWNKGQSQLIFCLSSRKSSDMATRRIKGAPVGLREANQHFSSLMQRVRNVEHSKGLRGDGLISFLLSFVSVAAGHLRKS
jgi:hypothetical protein